MQVGKTFQNPHSGTRMVFLEWTPERVVLERTYPPDTGRADAHRHLDMSQTWEVLAGQATFAIDGAVRVAGAGDRIEIAAGTAHQDFYNASEAALVTRLTLSPNSAFIAAFADCYAHYLTHDNLNDQDEFKQLQMLLILHATKAQSYLTAPPVALQKLAIRVGALGGRLRGYRARYS